MEPLRVGLCGLGTVAQGVLRILSDNAAEIERRAGRPIVVTQVASRRMRPEVDLGDIGFSTDVRTIPGHPDVDVVVELIGGEDTALELQQAALEAGKAVVTANKAVIALHGDELFEAAERQGVPICFEAAVAGGIPIISAITRGLAANEVQWIAGIINGTSNYILTAMTEGGEAFDEALAEAQRLGYAEADPTFDIEGIDAAHKLTILAALAFGMDFRFSEVYTEGIGRISVEDVEYARRLGYRIKHLGLARRTDAGVELRVHPTLVPDYRLLANVQGVMNAILVHGNAAGDTLYYGAGAGELPTASAVVADLVEVARGKALLPRRQDGDGLEVVPIIESESAYYLRIPALDRPGVFARVATILAEHNISIESAEQRAQAIHTDRDQAWVPIVIVTQRVPERIMNDALATVQALSEVVGEITRIRVDDLDDA
ncbi:MAG: homoserine dehydrogenase [Gammaproteobacteria bacterium]|nr:homoserine dehydrogenase [Gammaproteobacteria bacterium]MBK80183.1 homoserine dehydrogenase [Gammaproteobacteria bacterium]